MTQKNKEPFLPIVTIDDILSYRIDDAKTHTKSLLVNAVAKALQKPNLWDSSKLAKYLNLDRHKLSCALQIETGQSLQDIVIKYKLVRTLEYIEAHPKANISEVAGQNGYSSRSSLWRLLKRHSPNTLEILNNR